MNDKLKKLKDEKYKIETEIDEVQCGLEVAQDEVYGYEEDMRNLEDKLEKINKKILKEKLKRKGDKNGKKRSL